MNKTNELPPQEQIEAALEIAVKAHSGQRDLDGNAVILHPLTVALKGKNPYEIIAGLLHDVVEDTDYTFDDLLEAGISPVVVDALRLLTHDKEVDYLDSVRPHRRQPTRLLHPWDFPDKSTGAGCHCLLHNGRLDEVNSQTRQWNMPN